MFDTETTTDYAQALKFGAWRYYRLDPDGPMLIDEGLFYADVLPERDPGGYAELQRYVAKRSTLLGTGRQRRIRLLSQSKFVERVFFSAAYGGRDLVVGFNLPFDLSRLAIRASEGRRMNRGGFSLVLAPGKAGTPHKERRHRPRVDIKHANSKLAFMSFTKPVEPDLVDLIPDGSRDQKPDPGYAWRGRFLDLRTLAFALTGIAYSLQDACDAFGVQGKDNPGGHGKITEKYIDYCRQDAAATFGLYMALNAEFERHPVTISPERAYSPASMAKAYLNAMGLLPILDRQPDFSREDLGYAMSTFFGGRAECRIRRVPVPVKLTDFTSMYPTVGALMDLHRFRTAEQVRVVDATSEVAELLERVTLEDTVEQDLWPQLVGFVLVEPDGDILPVRAAYGGQSWGIGVNPLTSSEPLWYSIPDCVASKLLTGQTPKIVRAFRLVPVGRVRRLRSVKLRGAVQLDPAAEDPFRSMVEERQRILHRTDLPEGEKQRLSMALKIVANAGSFGIWGEFNRDELPKGKQARMVVYGRSEVPFEDWASGPEDPGRYCFPPLATCITGAARLMLAVLERNVTDLGGSWAFCDTDSMAIVCSERGGLVACPGGPARLPDGSEAVRALSFDQVESIRHRFAALNPYDEEVVPSILKDEATAMCFAISAKRYALYRLDEAGEPIFLEEHPPSEHGLGQLLNPLGPKSEDPRWIPQIWSVILHEALGLPVERPRWFARPTMIRTTVTSPAVLRAFRRFNEGKPYADQVKPFNFMLSAAGVTPPAGVGPGDRFRLVAPWESDPTRWSKLSWVDLHHPERRSYRITTVAGRSGQPKVDTYGDVDEKYAAHPEAKALGPDGEPCGRGTVGLLQRRPVTAGEIKLIGKESNRLEERMAGLVTVEELDDRLAVYDDDDGWRRITLPKLQAMGSKKVADAIGISERRARDILKGRAMPHAGHRKAMEALA
ncbi:MAG: hypothetical protein ABSA08_00970 [Acidimicrobiales bacterium]